MANYPWDQCIKDQKRCYGSKETAQKVCGMIRHKYGGDKAITLEIVLPDDFDLERVLSEIDKEIGLQPVDPLMPKDYERIDAEMQGKVAPVDVCPVCGQPFIEHAVVEASKATSLCKTPKFKRCVQHVQEQGKSEGSAYAICYTAFGKGTKSLDENALVSFGGVVKSLGEGKIGGYLVIFGSPDQADLEGDYFTPDTDFGPHTTSLVFYEHGLDGTLKRHVLDDGAVLKKDNVGVWIEAQLKRRNAYEKWIEERASKGGLGWSSGTAPHLVERVPMGKAMWIKRWYLGLDASITLTPAEPRTSVVPIKSLEVKSLQSLLDESGSDEELPNASKKRPSGAGADRKPGDVVKAIRRFNLSHPERSLKMNLIEMIKKLVPGLKDEQYTQIEAVLTLAGLTGEVTPSEDQSANELAEEAKSAALKKSVIETLKTLGITPPPEPPKTSDKKSITRPPYTFKPDGKKGDEGDEDDPQAGLKSVATLQFGEMPAAIKAIARDLYGEGYEVARYQQHLAYAKFLRHGDRSLNGDEQAALRMIILTPNQIKAMVIGGAVISAIKTDLAETVDSLGGFTVPEDLRLDMIERLPGLTVVRSRADVSPTSSDVMSKIKVTGGDDRHPGAMRITWVGDTPASNQAVTNPTFGVEKTPVHIAMCTVRVPRALLEDTAIPLAQKISEWASLEYAVDEDEQFLIGNGIAKPQGILPGATNALSLTRVASGDAATWPDANVVTKLMDLKYGIARQYRERAVWIVNDTTAATVSKVLDGVGRPIWYNSLREGEPDRLLGYPALTSEAMPDIAANAFPLIFGDLKGYQIADRVGMTLTRDELTESEQDIVKFVFRRRLGGQISQTWRFSVLQIAAA